jgi:hypothetical protein
MCTATRSTITIHNCDERKEEEEEEEEERMRRRQHNVTQNKQTQSSSI